jgi:signal transduction histidine kinase/ActR/RegA family two-component response regulator
MPPRVRSIIIRYGLALASLIAIMVISTVLQRVLPFRVDLTSLIIIAMIASAWFLGLGPGLMIAIILEVILDYFSQPPVTFRTAIIVFNRMVLFTGVVWFASSRRRAEQKLREQRKLLEDSLRREQLARRQAENADRLKDEFLATVSHELRTPLSAILGWASMLNMENFEEATTRNALAVIERNAKAQSAIIGDILDMSSIVTGKLRINAQPIQLAEVVDSAVDTLRLAAQAKNISLSVVGDEKLECVMGDPDRLRQVVWNLIANAIKFTPANGAVEVRLTQLETQVELRVSDSGIGISSEFLPHVFERFRQADSSSTRLHGGLGLGLAIVRHLVELHGGTVTVESGGEGRGSTFTVLLASTPEAELSQQLQPQAAPVREVQVWDPKIERPDLSGLRVLLVDDEPDTLEVLHLVLSQFGAQVRGAASTRDALQTFLEWKPDVLVSDLGMPAEDGYALIDRVRSLTPEQGGEVPAAALTAHVRDEDRGLALAKGYQAHIHKPVDPTRLAAAVADLAKNQK